MKRIMTLLLAALLLLSLAACGEEDAPYTTKDRYVFLGSSTELTDVGTPEKTVDPEAVYASLTYVPQMFYGQYKMIGGTDAKDEYGTGCSYTTRTIKGEERLLSTLPIQIEAGKNTLGHVLGDVKEHNWMELYFARKYEDDELNQVYLDFFICAYEVQGRKLIITPFASYDYDDDTKTVTYELSDQRWEYEFSFKGRALTLKSGEESITLTAGLDAYGKKDIFGGEGYRSPGSKSLGGLESLWAMIMDDGNGTTMGTADDMYNHKSAVAIESNGRMTITLVVEENGETVQKTYQCVYFCAGDDGWVLTDGTDTYFYNYSYSDYNYGEVLKFTGVDKTTLETLDESKLEEIAKKSGSLLNELAEAYQTAGMNVNVNRDTGEITLDTAVLFGVNETEVSEAGKTFLKQFMDVYTSVVFSESYEGFVSEIMVEGHTDTNGDYDYNMTLSQDRADSVKDYCLSSECSPTYSASLQTMLKAQGYSYDRPVYNGDGEVDMDASRRVSFRFIINLENV